MNRELYNSEGYIDPTPYQALLNLGFRSNLQRYRPVVYVCSPFAGNTQENQAAARRYSRFAVDMGKIPIAPHLLFPQFMDDSDESERKLSMFMDLVLLSKCAELWVFGDRVTNGMSIEIDYAKKKGKPIRWFDTKCREVNR